MEHHVCPWYIGLLLASPLRKLYQDPVTILGPYVKAGMNVLEVGPGMGFFSLPIARLIGDRGKLYSIDVQERMLHGLLKRARIRKLENIIEARRCSESSLEVEDLTDRIDFALAFAVAHEIPDKQNLLRELYSAMRQTGLLLVSEPRKHVSKEAFQALLTIAENIGFIITDTPAIRGSLSVLLKKA